MVRHGFAKGLRMHGGLDFLPRPSSREEQFLADLALDGKTVFDVGGFEGRYALGFARSVGPSGRVVVFEPNPVNADRIRRNVALNGLGNVIVKQIGLGHSSSTETLVIPVAEPSMGNLQSSYQERVARVGQTRSFEVEVDALDHLVASGDVAPPDLVKIDVEGYELDVLKGMRAVLRDHRPALFVEIHDVGAETREEHAREVVRVLIDHGYDVRIVESGESVAPATASRAIRGHVYCVAPSMDEVT